MNPAIVDAIVDGQRGGLIREGNLQQQKHNVPHRDNEELKGGFTVSIWPDD
jgi:hypothetical protein